MSFLPNYLLANRKRLNLSQGAIAFLIGVESSAKVSRHERFARQPSLETALAYEIIFKRAVCELFDGLYQEIEEQVAARARELLKETQPDPSNKQITRLREILADLASVRPNTKSTT